jgi:hypothetical protein
MVDGNRQGPVPIHFGHLAEKIWPMIRMPLEDVILPLMNHLVRQRVHDFLFAIFALLDDLLEEGKRQANLTPGRRANAVSVQPGPRSSTADE